MHWYLFVINETFVINFRPSDGVEIIDRAMEMIGEIGYNVLWSNCEHFASYCRYGRHKSDQVCCILM